MGELTENYSLYKPNVGEEDWGEEVNENWDKIDELIKALEEELEEVKKKCGTSNVKLTKVKSLLEMSLNEIQNIGVRSLSDVNTSSTNDVRVRTIVTTEVS